jgi:hypothetical protein
MVDLCAAAQDPTTVAVRIPNSAMLNEQNGSQVSPISDEMYETGVGLGLRPVTSDACDPFIPRDISASDASDAVRERSDHAIRGLPGDSMAGREEASGDRTVSSIPLSSVRVHGTAGPSALA